MMAARSGPEALLLALAIWSVPAVLGQANPCGPDIPYVGSVCSGHGTCRTDVDERPLGCDCRTNRWTGPLCKTVSNHYMIPDRGPTAGGSKIVFVVFDFDEELGLNLDRYMHTMGQVKVLFTLGTTSMPAEGFVITNPWDYSMGHPGAALGWARSASTFGRKWGEGYHIYDDNQTYLPDLPKNTLPDGTICRRSANHYCSSWVTCFTVQLAVHVHSIPLQAWEITSPELPPGVYQLTAAFAAPNTLGDAEVNSIHPVSVKPDGSSSITLSGQGFHKQGQDLPPPWQKVKLEIDQNGDEKQSFKDTQPLENMVVRLSIGPSQYSAIHDPQYLFELPPKADGTPQNRYATGLEPVRPWWPKRQTFYPDFTVNSAGTIAVVTMNGIIWPVHTVNTSIEITLTSDRQWLIKSDRVAFFEGSASLSSFEPLSSAYLVSPTVRTWRPGMHPGVLVPRARSVKVCVYGTGFIETNLTAVQMLSTPEAQGDYTDGSVVGAANATVHSSNKICFNTPGPKYRFQKLDFPKQMCQSQASSECRCDNWNIKRPTWGITSECCMQPVQQPGVAPWCYCENVPRFSNQFGQITTAFFGQKETLPMSAVCDLKFAPTMTFNTLLTVALNSTLGDYIVHPMKMYHYEDPVVINVTPQNVSFSQETNVTLYTSGFIRSSTLSARVYINGSTVPIQVNIHYHSPFKLSVIAPRCPVHNKTVRAELEFTLNGQDWHRTGTYNYGIPSYQRMYPTNLEVDGGVVVTIYGKQFMDTKDVGVRLRTTRGLKQELSRLEHELGRLTNLFNQSNFAENSLRSRAVMSGIWDASELRRMELEAYEQVKYLPLAIADVKHKISKTHACLAHPTYTARVTFLSTDQLTFIVPRMCVPDVHLVVELDMSHNMTIGNWGFQIGVLAGTTYSRLRVPSGDPPLIFLDRSKIRTERGAAEVGTFDISMDQSYTDSLGATPTISGAYSRKLIRQNKVRQGPEGEEITHTEVCKYLYRANGHGQDRYLHHSTINAKSYEKDRYNGKGVVDSDPLLQVPPHLYHQLQPESYTTLSRGDLPDAYSIYRGGQQQTPNSYYVVKRLGEVPVPREVESQCKGAACTVWQDAWQRSWTLPNITYEVVHCYKVIREPLVSSGKRDGYLKKYNSTGHEIWAVRMGGIENDELRTVTTDRWGNLHVTGNFFSSNISFDSKVLKQMVDSRSIHVLTAHNLTQASTKIRKMLVAKYNSGGKLIMTAEVGACWQDLCNILSSDVDDFGNVYVTGTFSGSITFGSMCKTSECDTVIQSDGAHKTSMNVAHVHPDCKPKFTAMCTKIPMVKMQSVHKCTNREYSGRGHKCEGDVFLAMLNPVGQLMWAKNLNTRNTFMQQSNIAEVDMSVLYAWSNRAYWAYFDRQTVRLGARTPHVRTQYWPPGGVYNASDSARYWWLARNSSHPVAPGLGSTPEWGNVCDMNGCQYRVPPSLNPGGPESRREVMSHDSIQRD